MFQKKRGSANIIIICFMGLALLLFYLLIGLDMLQYEYVTAKLNECVSEAILAADYNDQYMGSTYDYTLLDCSDASHGRCNDTDGCAYALPDHETAFSMAYNKADYRFKNSLADSLQLTSAFAVTDRTPCSVTGIQINDFRTYNYIDSLGAYSGLPEGRTYMKSSNSGTAWYDNAIRITAPNNDEVHTSGVYVDIEFHVKMFLGTTVIPVRNFVGIKK